MFKFRHVNMLDPSHGETFAYRYASCARLGWGVATQSSWVYQEFTSPRSEIEKLTCFTILESIIYSLVCTGALPYDSPSVCL